MSASLYQAGNSVDNLTTQPSNVDFVIPAGAPIGSIALFGWERSTGTDAMATPAGWSVVATTAITGSNFLTKVFGKKLIAGDPGSTVNFASSPAAGSRTTAAWIIIQDAGLLADVVVQSISAANTTTTMTAPTLTTTQSDTVLLTFFWGRVNTTTQLSLTPTGAQTERTESNSSYTTAGNYSLSIAQANSNTGAPGTYGGFTATASATLTHAHQYTISVPSGATYKKQQFLPFF